MLAKNKVRISIFEEMNYHFPQVIINEAKKLHGHLAPGTIVGFKLALRALRELKPNPEDIIILTSETTRCIPDGLQCLSRYLLLNGGFHVYHRTYDVGKLAIQVSKNNQDCFRLILNDSYIRENKTLNAWVNLGMGIMLDQEQLQNELWNLDLDAAFNKKSFKKLLKPNLRGREAILCPICGEKTTQLAMIAQDGKLICKICAFFVK